MLAGEPCKVLVRVCVVLLKLLDDIVADIGVVLLDLFGPAWGTVSTDLARLPIIIVLSSIVEIDTTGRIGGDGVKRTLAADPLRVSPRSRFGHAAAVGQSP